MSAPRRSARLASKNTPAAPQNSIQVVFLPNPQPKAPCPFEAEIALAEEAASKLFPTRSSEWYNELEKCEAYQNRRAAFFNKFSSISSGW
jgi:hypothetical protein